MPYFLPNNLHEAGSSSASASPYMDPTLNMLHDTFPYASRYHQEENFDAPQETYSTFSNLNTGDYDKYNRMLEEAQTPVYEGCSETVLSSLMEHMSLKKKHRTSNEHFDDYSSFIKRLLPPANKLPSSHYNAKKILNDLGLGYVKIEACKNNCVLFYGDYKDAFKCLKCNASRWEDTLSPKGKRIPMKVLRYFPLTPRLQRLYMCGKTAEDMRWHGIPREDDDALIHPANGEAWKSFDLSFPDFAADVRNVRLGLSTDGFNNPYGNMNLSYSIWPVIVVCYNLPPWMLMKKEYNMLALLIPGPKSPGKCLDVYLRPLIDESNGLWENGALTFDKLTGTSFMMRASMMWTINDFPGYEMMSSHTTKGYKACPLCLTDINFSWHADRVCYMGARRWLPDDHEWRLDASNFDGKQEFGLKPREWSGNEILDLLNSFNFGPLTNDHEVLAQNPKRPSYLDN
ncbi:PREDICTED: uncharacterized protein LOC101306777 [Fragaria vesca subsp. vesca]